MQVRLLLVFAMLCVAGQAGADPSAAAEISAADRAFLRAFEAPEEGVERSDSPPLKAHPLYPWLQARRLEQALSAAPDAALDARIEAFLDANGRAPYTQALRRQWLSSLAAREAWERLLAVQPQRPTADLRLCQWLTARLKLGRTEDFARHAWAAWRNGRSMPAACNAAFDWLEAQGLLDQAAVTERLRLALDANAFGLARFLTDKLPESERRIWVNARLVRQRRGRFIERLIASPDAPVFFEDLRAGLLAHARGQPEEAGDLLQRLLEQRSLSESERHALQRSVALAASWSRAPLALRLFRETPVEGHSEEALVWHARAALWAQDWQEFRRVLRAMPVSMQQDEAWRYWRARMRVARGKVGAEEAFAALARERSFYGFMAAERAGVAPTLGHQPAKPVPAAQQQLATLPAVQRARAWYALADDRRARAELAWAFAELDADGLEQAALMLHDWGWHQQAIAWMARAGRWDDLDLRFPLPHADSFARAAKDAGVALVWLHSIARTESLYDTRAVSSAGARGIAQLMPTTAQRVAARQGLDYDGRDSLFDADTNLRLSAHFLHELLERFEQRWLFVVPAYNAGPGRIPIWLPEAPLPADIWIENIPFNETRGYVRRALYHYVIIHWRLHGTPGQLGPLLAEPVRAQEDA
ncbi:transglycosylase SLT domain-containing protein [Algiphilus sp.]|uniref:transglycosylase SLT domain-containing protein n=1 Tax=Algiphilus sp. TaxID=1872431 RepID=UPI003B529197